MFQAWTEAPVQPKQAITTRVRVLVLGGDLSFVDRADSAFPVEELVSFVVEMDHGAGLGQFCSCVEEGVKWFHVSVGLAYVQARPDCQQN